MEKKVKTMETLLEKINVEKLKSVGVNDTNIAKVEALHDALRKGGTWDDDEVRQLFGILPDSFPLCTAYINTEILVRIGKAKPLKVVARPGIKDSRLKWVSIEKAEEFDVPAQLPIIGYEVICSGCYKTFVGKEPFHQNFCSNCSGRKVKDTETEVASAPVEPEIVKPVKEAKPKRKGRTSKAKPEAKPKKQTKRPPQKATKKGESKKRRK